MSEHESIDEMSTETIEEEYELEKIFEKEITEDDTTQEQPTKEIEITQDTERDTTEEMSDVESVVQILEADVMSIDLPSQKYHSDKQEGSDVIHEIRKEELDLNSEDASDYSSDTNAETSEFSRVEGESTNWNDSAKEEWTEKSVDKADREHVGEEPATETQSTADYGYIWKVPSKMRGSTETITSTTCSECVCEESSLALGPTQDTDISPFRLTWAFGVSTDVNVMNLTSKTRSVVFYACTHASVLYDYVEQTMTTLQGHKNKIRSISADDSGRWLVTSDDGEDNTIIMWDSFEHIPIPVNTIFDPHPKCGTAICAISGNAKYLISIGNELQPAIHFWLWTYGRNEPDDSYTVSGNYGLPCKICFNPDVQEHVWIIFEKQVLFFEWNTTENKLSEPGLPTIRKFKKYGLITSCTYFLQCHQCVTSTSGGFLLVFGNTLYAKEFPESQLINKKIFVKALKISQESITCVNSVDGLLFTGDDKGHIKVYDNKIKILFWYQGFQLAAIKSISFNLEKRNFKIANPLGNIDSEKKVSEESGSDNLGSVEMLYANFVPTDATVKQSPFVVRDFIVGTENGRIGIVDCIRNNIKFLNRKFASSVTAIDVHDIQPYLCIGFENGVIYLFNFLTKELIAEICLRKDVSLKTSITFLKYSPKGLHLASGTICGNLYFLDPLALTPKFNEPIYFVKNEIKKIAFSSDSMFCAYYNNTSTVAILKYSPELKNWEVLGKIRSHYKCINDILFSFYLPTRLFTIGADRILQEYDLSNSGNDEIVLASSTRIEQCATPIAFIYQPQVAKEKPTYFYMCDDKFKYKVLHDTTFMCHRTVLGPAYGCYEKSPVNKIEILPGCNDKYMIYANSHYFGIQKFPPDGNPHKYVGTVGHPTQLIQFRTDSDGKYVFTIGKNDNCVLMWEVNTESVEKTYQNGGSMLEPYYCLIEGGINGWLFKEMQDLFYYMQILHQGENSIMPRNVSEFIPVQELPDLMRAVGFYPSEYEIETMIVDIKYRDFDETKTLRDELSFLDFIQMYINYRPAHGISVDTLKTMFNEICVSKGNSTSTSITSNDFVDFICKKGETFTKDNAYRCLTTLMSENQLMPKFEKNDFSFLPLVIDFRTFFEEVLGVDVNRQSMMSEEIIKSDEEQEEQEEEEHEVEEETDID